MITDPFFNSNAVAKWAADHLDEVKGLPCSKSEIAQPIMFIEKAISMARHLHACPGSTHVQLPVNRSSDRPLE